MGGLCGHAVAVIHPLKKENQHGVLHFIYPDAYCPSLSFKQFPCTSKVKNTKPNNQSVCGALQTRSGVQRKASAQSALLIIQATMEHGGGGLCCRGNSHRPSHTKDSAPTEKLRCMLPRAPYLFSLFYRERQPQKMWLISRLGACCRLPTGGQLRKG